MLIPGLPNLLQVRENDLSDPIQLLRRESVVVRQGDRFEPELADLSLAAHVDVPGLIAIEAIEEETERA
jgi:hypothetical protein